MKERRQKKKKYYFKVKLSNKKKYLKNIYTSVLSKIANFSDYRFKVIAELLNHFFLTIEYSKTNE